MQNLRTGQIEIQESICPSTRPGHVLIETRKSLISPGTEKMLIEFSKANLFQKARMQPDKVRQVLDKAKTDGILPTINAVSARLAEPLPLGYCNAGIVIEVGEGIEDLKVGDRVASNGSHSDVVSVPRNLATKIPDGVSFDEASFTVMGSIALHGVRLCRPSIGEQYVVFGMGLVGLLAIQFLRASGCEVLALDLNASRLSLANKLGACTADISDSSDLARKVSSWTGGRGVDGALITASAKNDEIMHQAAQSCRKRGKIVLIGVVDLDLRREDFYEKELTFQVSCSYGPGRYDEKYEQMGIDYPEGYVRWTEGRNFAAVLSSIASRKLDVKSLITDNFDVSDVQMAYHTINSNSDAIGVVLDYGDDKNISKRLDLIPPKVSINSETISRSSAPNIGVIGTGNFATLTILPLLAKSSVNIKYIAGRSNGTAAVSFAKKFHVATAVTDYKILLEDDEVSSIFVLTRHDSHASLVMQCLTAGKDVFVEKPLCISESELDDIVYTYQSLDPKSRPYLMVGFNRRFSPHIKKVKDLLLNRDGPLTMNMTVNAGYVEKDHWTQDPAHGGRIIGEACHFIDLLSYIAGSSINKISALSASHNSLVQTDNTSITMSFEDGSIGTVHYYSNGSRNYPKEDLKIFSDGKVLTVDNFKVTKGYGYKGFRKFKSRIQDKGHANEIRQFLTLTGKGGRPLISFDSLVNVTKSTILASRSSELHHMVTIEE